jgi:superfamily II DNA/RNA helicase
VLKLLKKRLFSSPAAFLGTLEVHLETLRKPVKSEAEKPRISLLRREINHSDDTFATDDEFDEALKKATVTATRAQRPLSASEMLVINELQQWAQVESNRADSKAKQLINWLEKTLKPSGQWNDERVIIFTEYRATQAYLQTILAAHGFTQGGRLKVFFWGMDKDDREHIQAEFQADPSLSPLRILLATDTASKGIDLQKFCHRLIHYEIP